MEAAAKTVELLTQRTLPETPYYLSNSPDWRYRPRPDDSTRPEEWHSTRLQYSTLLAEADRGVLLTRPDYDMREEPPKPVSRDIASLAKSGAEKKKLSLSDYKNKKTATASTSPPEPAITKLKESERAGASASSSPAGSATRPSDARANSDSRRSLDPRQGDVRKHRPDGSNDARPRPKDYTADMSLPVKPPLKNYPLPPRPPSPGSKKRVADHDDDARPQKRSRPENTRPSDERPSHRDDSVRRKDQTQHGSGHKESPLLNGKSSLKSNPATGKGASPAVRPRGDSLNGTRPGAGAGKSTPGKQESPNKPILPPLLSPLRLSFEGDSPPKHDRRRSDGTPPPRSKKPENLAEEKKRRPQTRVLPPLLSPTLPPLVEAALRRKKQASAEPEARPREREKERDKEREKERDKEREKERERKEPLPKPKKASSTDDSEDEAPLKPARRLLVRLRIPKKLRKSVQRILAMPPARDRKHETERSTDEERQTARKRPPAAAPEAASVPMKKSRSSDVPPNSFREPRPTTPPRKNNTAMSRVNSNNSTAHTPGETMNRTPSFTGTGPNDKRLNGAAPQPPAPPAGKLDLNGLKEKESHMRKVGTQLKHSADNALKGRRSPSASFSAKDNRPRSASHDQPNPKLGSMLGIESILCFMQGFQAQSTLRTMYGKKPDPTGWLSLFPLSDYILSELQRHESKRNRPAYALLLLLQVFAADEVIRCNLAQDPGPGPAMEVVKHERLRSRALGQIREAHAQIENPKLRADVAPWSTLDDVTETTLRVMRRWCHEEDVHWTPELSPRDYGR